MQTIVLTRENTSIPWGFRLKGGYEYNVPLSILKVNEGSPSYNLLECGDVLVNIGKYSALNMKHEEALNIIRMFEHSMQLVVQRDTTPRSNPKASSAVWRPPSLASQQSYSAQPTTPTYSSNSYSNFNFNSYSTPSSTDYTANATNYYSDSETSSPYISSRHYNYSSAQPISPPLVQPTPAPPAPPLPANFQSNYREEKQQLEEEESYRDANNDVFENNLYSQSAGKSYGSETNISTVGNSVPDRLLKALNTPSASGRKPFTYTPGGLDLSHVRQSARVKRYEQLENQREQEKQFGGSSYSFENQYSAQSQYAAQQSNQYQSQSSNQYSSQNQSQYQYSSPAPAPTSQYSSPSYYQQPQSPYSSSASHLQSQFSTPSYQAPQPFSSQYASASAYSSGHQASSNLSSYLSAATATPATPSYSSYSASVPSSPAHSSTNSYGNSYTMPKSTYTPPSKQNQPGFVVKPEQLLNRKKDDNTQRSQSYSFKMLNKWIEESENNQNLMTSKKDEAQKNAEEAEKAAKAQKSAVAKLIEEEERRGIRPVEVNTENEPASIMQATQPPINFQQHLKSVPKSYQKVNYGNESNLESHARPRGYEAQEFHSPRVPARERDQEGDAPHYKGSVIPSRTFRYLQHLTEDEAAMMESIQNESHAIQQYQKQHQSASSYSNNSVTFENHYSADSVKNTKPNNNYVPNPINNENNNYSKLPKTNYSRASISGASYTGTQSATNFSQPPIKPPHSAHFHLQHDRTSTPPRHEVPNTTRSFSISEGLGRQRKNSFDHIPSRTFKYLERMMSIERDDPVSSASIVEQHHQQKHQEAHASHHEQTANSSHEVSHEAHENLVVEAQKESSHYETSGQSTPKKENISKQSSHENEPAEETQLQEPFEQLQVDEPAHEEEIAINIPTESENIKETVESASLLVEAAETSGEANAEPAANEQTENAVEPPECTSDF